MTKARAAMSGKARNLRAGCRTMRVPWVIRGGFARMISGKPPEMMFLTTRTETEALLPGTEPDQATQAALQRAAARR